MRRSVGGVPAEDGQNGQIRSSRRLLSHVLKVRTVRWIVNNRRKRHDGLVTRDQDGTHLVPGGPELAQALAQDAPPPPAAPPLADHPTAPVIGRLGVGIVVPYDFALDRELWRWAPDHVTLHITRTPYEDLPVNLEQARLIGVPSMIADRAHDLIEIQPDAIVYACTAGSFVRGQLGQAEIVEALLDTGIPAAVTTSGALLAALEVLDIHTISVATPYDDEIGDALRHFLDSAGVQVNSNQNLGLHRQIWTVPYEVTADLVRRCVQPGDEAIFVSCTNLPTYDVIAPLEAEIGIPVLTANQVTMWAALRALATSAVGPDQRLITASAGTGPHPTTAQRLINEGVS